jgi:rhodanese-related sulfurtransferase
MFKYVTMREAHQQQDDGSIYLDVRSVSEYQQAHPAGSSNTGWMQADLPVETTPDEACQYDALQQKAEGR